MQTPKARNNSAEAPKKSSPRIVRQLKTTTIEATSSSFLSPTSRTPKDRSPKVTERRSPRSPASELQKKRPSRVSELESQISQLQEDLKKTNDQLSSSESWKRRAEQDADDSKEQLLALSSKLEESQKQLLELSANDGAHPIAFQKHHSIDSGVLASAVNEIQKLGAQIRMIAEADAAQTEHIESAETELLSLKQNLAETFSLMVDMKTLLGDSKESEVQAQGIIDGTLLQLETAKRTVENLISDGMKAKKAYNSVPLVVQSQAHVNSLEGLLCKLKPGIGCENTDELGAELTSVKAELGRLRTALEAAEIKHHEELVQSTLQIKSATETAEQIKSESSIREAKLVAELNKTKAHIEELKANLMDKETELQGISEENEGLNKKFENSLTRVREHELEKELRKSKEEIEDLKANLMVKETELQNISEIVAEVESVRAKEQEALMKLGYMTEEADKSKKRAARVAEQLAAAEAANSEMEAELRRLKVQSNQWRKAAEAAAAMLSTGNNGKLVERTVSLDSTYNPITGKTGSPCSEDIDDDLFKKKNGNVLKKIGVMWKKPQK